MSVIIQEISEKENQNDSSSVQAPTGPVQSEKISRYLFFFINLLLLNMIIALMVVTYSLTNSWNHYSPFLDVYTNAVGGSVLCTCVSLATLWVAANYVLHINLYKSYIYFTVGLCAVMLFEVLLLVSGYLYTTTAAKTVAKAVHTGILQYKTSPATKKNIDTLQNSLQCCGKYYSVDWYDSPRGDIPFSCCPNEPSIGYLTNSCAYQSDHIFSESCVDKLLEIPSAGINFIACFITIVLFLKGVSLILTFRLAKLVKN